MTIPSNILQLAERYHDQRLSYRSGQYPEAQLRLDFLDPFFEALGWDVCNSQGLAHIYREVLIEQSIQMGEQRKAPDYTFRVGREAVFYVEAKRPSVNLKLDSAPAFQLRRYAWNTKLPLSILTDFEEFAVYDCRARPLKMDKATSERTLYIGYEEYASKWDEIAAIFSRQAVLQGSLDQYAETTKSRRGYIEVDDAFLAEIERWRDTLARNLALRNPNLSQAELNFAVQMTIDRLIFLRICEDREIEPFLQLKDQVAGTGVYEKLCHLFRQADARYNSGLFHFNPEKGQSEAPDTFTLALAVDDKPLKEIIGSVYDSSYDFSVMPADILGQVYEQFLGKVIRLTAGHRAVVEDKPEVKKAGGVFYTPTYIVEYIVQHTVGELLKEKKPGQAGVGKGTPIRIADPACGSGSFLIGAYQFLLDWYLAGYLADGAEKWAKGRSPMLYQAAGGEWKLTTAERKRILLDHIYGVDIDQQAVEVTKLSLLLKVLEGENEQSLGQLGLFKERVLPDLAQNIKCGNSLIGPEIEFAEQTSFLADDEQKRINAFDWHSAFATVFAAAGGFDAIIGNPPYIRIQALKEWAPREVEFYKKHYHSASKGNYDIYVVFVEKGLGLLNEGGRLGFILPHKFFNAQYGQPLRELLSKGRHLAKVVHFGDQQVFENATTYTCLMFLDKAGQEQFEVEKVTDLGGWRGFQTSQTSEVSKTSEVSQAGMISAASVNDTEWNFTVGKGTDLFEKLSRMPVKLGDIVDRIAQGIRTSANEVYVLDTLSGNETTLSAFSKQLNRDVKINEKSVYLFLQGREIKRYRILHSGKVVIVPYVLENGHANLISESEMKAKYPETFAYLVENKTYLENREKGRMKGSHWHAYIYPKNIEVMSTAKILVPDIADRAQFSLDEDGMFAFTSGYAITVGNRTEMSLKYLLGLLNSKVLDYYLKRISTPMQNGFFRYFTQFIERLPIPVINFSSPIDNSRYNSLVALVTRMLTLHQQLAASNLPAEKTRLQRQVEATDREIDHLVYQLYDLTPEEIAIVEKQP